MSDNVHILGDKTHQVFILEGSSVVPAYLQESMSDMSLAGILSNIFRKLEGLFFFFLFWHMTNTTVVKIKHNNHVVTETKAKQPRKLLLLWGNYPTRTDRGLSQLGIQLNPLVKRFTTGKEGAAAADPWARLSGQPLRGGADRSFRHLGSKQKSCCHISVCAALCNL